MRAEHCLVEIIALSELAFAEIFSHCDDVLKVGLPLGELELIGMREAAVEAHPDTRARKL